ncbi:hypothetical protein SAMN02910370_02090 [Lachnospiraceae bacterium XPB1003]|nr:hypothetical protein SAMN02910370_02090 [Lachnospiraceae bacterium XPB1003]
MSDENFFDFDGDGDVDFDDVEAGFHSLFDEIDMDHDGVPDINKIRRATKGFMRRSSDNYVSRYVSNNHNSGYSRTHVAKYVVTQDGLRIGKQTSAIGTMFNKVINKKSKIGISSNDAYKMRVEDIMNLLYDAHFENVVAKRINDLRIDQREMEGLVTEIKINGKKSFASGVYPVNSEIQIVYHELMLAYPPIASNHVKKRNKDEIANLFRQAGFVNVYLIPEKDIIFGLINHEDQVDNVFIAGLAGFSKDTAYKIDTKVSITYHSR